MNLVRNTLFKAKNTLRHDYTKVHIHAPSEDIKHNVTLIPGYGVGKELSKSVTDIFKSLNVPVVFETIDDFNAENAEHLQKVKKNQTILLGVMAAQTGLNPNYNDNFKFYKQLELYANINLAFSVPSIKMRHQNVDIAIVKENSEGEFSGIQHQVYPGVMQSLKVTTRQVSERLIRYAFNFAHLSGRKKITVVHKANIMKLVDGLFIHTAREIAKQYPFIKYEEMIVDNASMQLVKTPSQFDVIVTSNLYGNILTHICSGITGKVGMTPGAFVGDKYALFTRALPRTGIRIAGKNVVNPTSMILSSVMMLRYLNLPLYADAIGDSIKKVLNEGKVRTADIGGTASTTQFTKEVINNIKF